MSKINPPQPGYAILWLRKPGDEAEHLTHVPISELLRIADAMVEESPEAKLRRGHAAYVRGERDPETIQLHHEYDRARKKGERDARKRAAQGLRAAS